MPNTIKHCLVTKHANVKVSGQMVKTCLIKHRSNNWYKPLSKRGTHACVKHVWYAAVQTIKTSLIKHENKRNKRNVVARMFDGLQILLNTTKHDQTRSNTNKHDRTAPNKVSKRQNVWSPNNVWLCLVAKHLSFFQALRARAWTNNKMFVHQTMFDGVWSPNICRLSRP